MNSAPDFEDDVPTGITKLPVESQPWALGIHKAVRDIRGDIRFLVRAAKLVPIVTGGIVGAIEIGKLIFQHYK